MNFIILSPVFYNKTKDEQRIIYSAFHVSVKDILLSWRSPPPNILLILTDDASMVQNIILKADCHSAYKKYPAFFMEPEGSPPWSQKPAIGLYPEPA
jgi:hypothetical protein